MSIIRVVIVDDHPHARQGIRELLTAEPSVQVVAEGTNGHDAIRLAEEHQPDVMIMDIRMPGIDGLEATGRIRAQYPQIRIIIVTVSDDVSHLFEALKKGAQGYLLKHLDPSGWLEYFRACMQDEVKLSKELATQMLQEFMKRALTQEEAQTEESSRYERLTAREREVLELVASGKTNREVAESLFITENTVKNHLKNIMSKLRVDNRVQLAKFGRKRQ